MTFESTSATSAPKNRIERETEQWKSNCQAFAEEWLSGRMGDNIKRGHRLYDWAENQRRTAKSGQMPSWKREMLTDIQFPWKGGRHYDSITEKRINELQVFRERFGHFRVRQRDPGCREMANWLARLRRNPRQDVIDAINFRLPEFTLDDTVVEREYLPRLPDGVQPKTARTEAVPTPWFEAEELPVHKGWYEVETENGEEMVGFWCRGWFDTCLSTEEIFPVRWRGLSSVLD